jgi:CheY-like chemotaxis protein
MHDRPVLIVEDDTDARESLAALLEGEGYRVLEAQHGGEALEVLRQSPVCLILLDIFMPVMNGHAFMVEQSRDPAISSIPVVVMTADAAAARAAVRRGVADAMTKPLDHDRLLEVIAHHC